MAAADPPKAGPRPAPEPRRRGQLAQGRRRPRSSLPSTRAGRHGSPLSALDVEVVESSRDELATADTDLDRFQTIFTGDGFAEGRTADVSELNGTLRGDAAGSGVEPDPGDIIVAVVEHLVPAALGCNAYPVEQPGVVLSALLASPWTLAHELGLNDDADPASLMFADSDPGPDEDPPTLSDADAATIRASPLAQG